MARTNRSGLRGLWRDIHLWIGVGLFVLLVPLGLSGTFLVWEDPLDQVIHPARYAVTAGTLAPDTYLDTARQAFAGRALPAQLRMPEKPGLPVAVVGYAPVAAKPGQRPPSLTAWLDPGSGRLLGVADPRAELRGVIHNIHGNMMMAQNGRTLVGWLGVAMLISSITGLILWWPRGSFTAAVQGLRWGRSASVFSNLHHMAGFWICLPLAVLSLSGAWIAFPQAMHALTAPLQPAPAGGARTRGGDRPGFVPPDPAPKMRADDALAAALKAAGGAPGARLAQLTLPTAGDKPAWRIQLKGAGPAPVSVRVADATGKARVQDGGQAADGSGGGDPFARFMRRLHDGSGYGLAWQVIISVAGLAPAVLGVTGVLIWAKRRKIGAPKRH
jgi:uncharacterized iron-regulated membrane protein